MEKKILALLCALLLVALAGCAAGEPAQTTTAPIETTVHVHEYAVEVVEATCTKGGYTG